MIHRSVLISLKIEQKKTQFLWKWSGTVSKKLEMRHRPKKNPGELSLTLKMKEILAHWMQNIKL